MTDLGQFLYRLEPTPLHAPGQLATLTAAGLYHLVPDTHDECAISSFCRNPLHPGPCKGWKKKLGVLAPGVLKAAEAARKAQVAKKRAATQEAKSKAAKGLTERDLAHPLAAKKKTIKAANTILGDDEVKAEKKAGRVILNKAEIKKYSKIKGAQIAATRGQIFGTSDESNAKYAAWAEGKIAAALAEDNKDGGDANFRQAINEMAQAMSIRVAEDMCKDGDGDCDGEPFEALMTHVEGALFGGLLYGKPDALDQVKADYEAGKLDLTVAQPDPEPGPEVVEPEAGAPEAAAPPAPKKPAKKKATPAPKTGTAAQAEKGKDFALGVKAKAKGNKTLGTKKYQAEFEGKLAKALEEGDPKGIIPIAAGDLANYLLDAATKPSFTKPYLQAHPSFKDAAKTKLKGEMLDGIQGGDAPKPATDAILAILAAKNDVELKEGQALLTQAIKGDPTGQGPNKAAGQKLAALITDVAQAIEPSKPAKDKEVGLAIQLENLLDAKELGKIEQAAGGFSKKLANKLSQDNGGHDSEQVGAVATAMELEMLAVAADPDAEHPVTDAALAGSWTSALAQATGGEPASVDPFDSGPGFGLSAEQQAAVDASTGMSLTDEEAVAVYEALSKADFDDLTPDQQDAIINDLTAVKNLSGTTSTQEDAEAQLDYLLGNTAVDDGIPVPDPADAAPAVAAPLMTPAQKKLSDQINAKEFADPEDVLIAISDIPKGEFDAMSQADKDATAAFLAAKIASSPDGFVSPYLQHKLGLDSPVPGSIGGPKLNAAQQLAVDYANGFKSGTAKVKLPAYTELDGDDFAKIDPNSQKLILADLNGMQKKFLGPNKTKAKAAFDYLSAHAGGGAGAGGAPDAPTPAALTPEMQEKLAVAKFGTLIEAYTGKALTAEGEDLAHELVTKSKGGESGVEMFADIHAIGFVNSLDATHTLNLTPEEKGELAAILGDELKANLLGSPAPTPVIDAAIKAHGGTDADVAAFMTQVDLAENGKLATPSTPTAPTSAPGPSADELKAKADFYSKAGAYLWLDASPFHESKSSPAPTMHKALHADALANGEGSEEHLEYLESQAKSMSLELLDQVYDHLGFKDSNGGTVSPQLQLYPLLNPTLDQMQAEFLAAHVSGLPAVAGLAEMLPQIAKDVKAAAASLAAKQGWTEDSAAVEDYKIVLYQAKVEALLQNLTKPPAPAPKVASSSPAGAGGGTTAPNPGIVTKPTPMPSSVVVPPIGTGTEIDDIPMDIQNAILADLKGFSSGKYLDDPKETTYGNLLTLAAVHGTVDKPLSVLQVLKATDNAFSLQKGWTNTFKWEQTFVDWLKTPEGTAFAAANPTPNENLVKKLKGVYEGISTDLAELSKKVKLLPGPGGFDKSKTSADFPIIDGAHADKLRKQMLAGQGGKYTSAQLAGIKIYTGSSYMQMNSWLRAEPGTSDLSAHYKSAIKKTQDAMRPLPEDIIVHRGTGWEQLPEGFRSPSGAAKLVGKTIMDEAFMSTSVGGTAAFNSYPLILEIEAPKGTQAAYVDGSQDGSKISSHPGEREMLLAAGQQFEVISVDSSGYQTKMRIRIVTPDAA
jgi:hypothetical protein